ARHSARPDGRARGDCRPDAFPAFSCSLDGQRDSAPRRRREPGHERNCRWGHGRELQLRKRSVTYPEMSAIPFSRPSKVIAVGLNYGRHATEAYVDVLPWPVTFARFPSRLIDTGEPIRIPPGSVTVDDEAELAVVMGKTTRSVSRDDVLAYTAGYMCLNDITDCDTRTREGQCPGKKSFDNTSEISDPQSLAIRARLNGQGVQDAST